MNGSEVDSLAVSAINGDTTTVQLSGFCEVVAADDITMAVTQSSGGALNMDVARIAIYRLGVVS